MCDLGVCTTIPHSSRVNSISHNQLGCTPVDLSKPNLSDTNHSGRARCGGCNPSIRTIVPVVKVVVTTGRLSAGKDTIIQIVKYSNT